MCRCRMGNPKKSSRFICLAHIGINQIGDGIQRSNQREKNHVKDLYCLQCKDITKNIEVRYCDSFNEMMEKAEELHREYYGKEVDTMKNYKYFKKEYIGSSDIASLILAGYKEDIGLSLQELHFGGDGSYNAYIVKGKDVEIEKHYNKVAEYDSWMKIYDDEELARTFKADKIIVYRAAEMGCIIQLINDMEE